MPAKSQIKKASRRRPEALRNEESKADLLQEGLLFSGLGGNAEQFPLADDKYRRVPFVGIHFDKLVMGEKAAASIESV